MSRRSLVALLLLVGSFPYFGGARQWTPAEEHCAQLIGVPLAVGTQRADSQWLKYLAWSGEIAVFGEVKAIESDLDGPYHTIVTISVSDYWKGSGPTEVRLALHSGPSYFPAEGIIGEVEKRGEPSFSHSEEVLVFLDTSYLEPTVGDHRYILPPGYWRVTGGTKLVQQGASLVESDHPFRTWTIRDARDEVTAVVDSQISLCAGGK